MIALGVRDITISFGVDVILDKVSFSVEEGDKLAIVGVNGAGKSTLLKIICKELIPDSGQVFIDRDKSLGFLSQHSSLDNEKCILDEMLSVFSVQLELEKTIEKLEKRLSVESTDDLIKSFTNASDKYRALGGYEYKSRTKSVLVKLGFPEEMHSLPIKALSGGQKTTLSLARLILINPDILILDEPTNHLDISALVWLEDYISSIKSTVIVVSHDRYFLDRTTNKTLEIENTGSKLYNVSYTAYREQKKKDREIAEKHYKNQQKEISRLEAYIEQQRRWNRERNIIAAESREKAIARMDKVEKPQDEPDSLSFKFNDALRSGNDVLKVEGLEKSFENKTLFNDLSFEVKKDERFFILGPNGCGKSTLLKILISKITDFGGSFEFGYNVKIGYYDQEYQGLSNDNTVIDELWQTRDFTQTEIRSLLAMFMFKGDDVFKSISVLSGGEKARLTLAKLMQKKVNVLILDEPTNHLDINSREALENALTHFSGTIIAVSHDRYFIKSLANHILELYTVLPNMVTAKGAAFDFKGSYEDFLEFKNKFSLDDTSKSEKTTDAKAKYLENKKMVAEKRRLEKQRVNCENRIVEIENRIAEIDNIMSSEAESNYTLLQKLFEEKTTLEVELMDCYEVVMSSAGDN